MKGLRDGIIVLLCGLFLYNSMGYIVVHSVMRSNLKKQFFAEITQLPEESLVRLTFLTSDKSKLFVDKRQRLEIKLRDQMYDVVKSKVNSDSTTYYCVRDTQEEQIIRKMSILNQRNNESPLRKSSVQIIDHLIKIALIQKKTQQTDYSKIIKFYDSIVYDYTAPLLNILVPPPQFLS
jgi:hypothetical protein